MRIISSLILSLPLILNSIELSSQTSNPGPVVPRSEISYSSDRHRALGSSNRSPPAEPSLRDRSVSPPARVSPSYIFKYTLEQLKYIRFIPHTNLSRRFEIQRYTFPRDKPLQIRGVRQVLLPVPTEKQTVLATSSGEVFAIVENNRNLRGIYIRGEANYKRAKINMYSGAVGKMTREEVRETPLGKNSSIAKCFGILDITTELSSQTLHPGPGVPHFGSSYSSVTHEALGSSNRSSPPAEPPLRARSRSPPASHSPLYILGYTLEELQFIRLIPHTNPSRQFEIRRFTFPRDKLVQLRGDNHVLQPMPTEEQSVLSTSNGEVFAIVEASRRLRGIYTTKTGCQKRAKINMYSGVVEEMTKEEVREAPSGSNAPISTCFEILHMKRDSSAHFANLGPGAPRPRISDSPDRHHALSFSDRSSHPTEPPLRERSRSPPASYSPSYILGFKLKELEFVRLIPYTNPLRRFEIRRYTFPRDKLINIRGDHNARVPMPIEEQTVLSTSNGEVFAIVEDNRRLRGIYTIRETAQKRAKINMYSGVVEVMSAEEIEETPLGSHCPISTFFRIVRENVSTPRLIRFPILNRFES